MRGLKVIAMAATLALVFCVALVAQAGLQNKVTINSKKIDPPGASVKPADPPVPSRQPGDPPSGPIGTPGSDKTIKAHVQALEIAVAALQGVVTNLRVRFSNLSSHVSATSNLQARFTNLSTIVSAINSNNALDLGPFIEVHDEAIDGVAGPNIFFKGANIHIVSGSGATDDFGTLRHLGNMIIGYDESPAVLDAGDRGGSHNLVIGQQHKFSSVGGFVAGFNNIVSGQNASVSGGQNNKASGRGSVASGGAFINATGIDQWAHP